jgi:hypothetical protein
LPFNPLGAISHGMRCSGLAVLLALSSLAFPASAQSARQSRYYSRVNSFGFFAGYSGDSSHIVIGNVERRKLLLIGASYNRRLTLNHIASWQYSAEIQPVALESDPLTVFVNEQTSPVKATFVDTGAPTEYCSPFTINYSFPGPSGETYAGTATTYCHGRRWTMGEGMSPVGFQWNFLPTRKLQPTLAGHGGYMFSTHEIPVPGAGSFNFTFDLGVGVELFRTRSRSIRIEYRYHHISNDRTAAVNPGIDNGLVQMTYSFGR